MMRRILRYPQLSAIGCLLGIISLSFAWPLLASVTHGWFGVVESNFSGDGWGIPFARSAIFSVLCTVLSISLGFLIAVLARDCSGITAILFALLMVPMLMGGVAVAFCVKVDILHSVLVTNLILNRAFIPTWGLMLLAQAWQTLPLSVYLFWFRLQQTPVDLRRFSIANHLTAYEHIRDIAWPFCRNLAGMMGLFFSTISFYEFIKFALIIRASPGGSTELASHWLLRLYDFYATLDPRVAVAKCLAMSALAIIVATSIVFCSVQLALRSVDLAVLGLAKLAGRSNTKPHPGRSNVVAICVMLLTLVPMLGLAQYVTPHNFIDISEFSRSAALAFAAALVTLLVSVTLGISGRLIFRRLMERFDSRSAIIFAALYFLQVIPPIGIALCGYYWLGAFASYGNVASWIPGLWLICQVIIALPITASFVQLSHFRVATTEIDFQESARVGLVDIVWNSFIRRFTIDYMLVTVFGFSIIWTESTINSTISDLSQNIPSVSVELAQRVDGRGASYPEAANLILSTLLPVVLGLLLWVYNSQRNNLLLPSKSDREGI